MKHYSQTIGLLSIVLCSFFACKKNEIDLDNNSFSSHEPKAMHELQVPSNFNYTMVQEMPIRIKVLNYTNEGIPNIKVNVYSDVKDDGGRLLLSGMTNKQGEFETKHPMTFFEEKLYIEVLIVGMKNTALINIEQKTEIEYTFGGDGTNSEREIVIPPPTINASLGAKMRSASAAPVYQYMGTYDGSGVPNYLTTPEVIDQTMLDDINASLPEGYPVPQFNAQYLSSANVTQIELSSQADVWITFLHEGAGYRNSLAYYTYNLNNPPSSVNDIDTINIIFPNMSFPGSGGNLNSGDRVYLGNFSGGTGIGWVLIANGWTGSSVGTGLNRFYSQQSLNPEISGYQQHNVILLDDIRNKLLIGFEDLLRNPGAGSDEDFNDAIFYADVTPLTSIANRSLFQPTQNTAPDADADGVPDYADDYPNDPARAFNKYYPSATTYGTLAFEDMWPTQGDYDCNDLVVDYRFMHVTNANNEVLEIDAELVIQAIGAANHNALGFQLGINPASVQQVSGMDIRRNYLNFAANGCETGQTKAVFFAFDEPHWMMPPPSGFTVNTEPQKVKLTPDTTRMSIVLNSPVDENLLTLPPYNPFLVKHRDRSIEVHLPGYEPTDLVNTSLFGTEDDATDPAQGIYYKTQNNLPWALHFPQKFDYPVEKAEISSAYLFFAPWAQSGGGTYNDWFTNTSSREIVHIYQ